MLSVVNGIKLSSRTIQYLETILWAETVMLPVAEEELIDDCMDVAREHPLHDVSECDPLDHHFSLEHFTEESLCQAESDCEAFFDRLNKAGLADRASCFADDDQIAHDFWLTRNGHGAGFWDGDYCDDFDDVGDLLSAIADGFGGRDVGVTPSGRVEIW